MADRHKRIVPDRKQLVLRERTVQPIDRRCLLPGKLPAEDPHRASLLTAADKSRINDAALIGGKHQCLYAIRILIALRSLIPRGQKQQHHHQNQCQHHRECGVAGK